MVRLRNGIIIYGSSYTYRNRQENREKQVIYDIIDNRVHIYFSALLHVL